MGGDSCSEGRGFESQHHKLDGHFLHINFLHKFYYCLKRPKIKEKDAGNGPFKKTFWPIMCCAVRQVGNPFM